ncbi:unnamed protein product, partial [Nesidiocoris tenuis]
MAYTYAASLTVFTERYLYTIASQQSLVNRLLARRGERIVCLSQPRSADYEPDPARTRVLSSSRRHRQTENPGPTRRRKSPGRDNNLGRRLRRLRPAQ